MSVGTLRKWIGKSNRATGQTSEPVDKLPDDLPAHSWGPAERLQALLETHAMPQRSDMPGAERRGCLSIS